jgi:hypothetical protein
MKDLRIEEGETPEEGTLGTLEQLKARDKVNRNCVTTQKSKDFSFMSILIVVYCVPFYEAR